MFLFDLDGTITKQETLPIIAKEFNLEAKINELTSATIQGNIPFIESFIQRVNILKDLPITQIDELLENIPLFKNIVEFIEKNNENCIIITGNLDVWVKSLLKRINCKYYSSSANTSNNNVETISEILKKEDIVKNYQLEGYKVVVIGDGNNDLEAMRLSDISIACGLIHHPANSLLTIVDYVVYDEAPLVRLLTQINAQQKGTSIVLSCAGIGSRLGLSMTKALIRIENKSLIHWQLESFKNVEDVRIVIGYQALDVIKEVLEKSKNIIFAFNHDYFNTKTGASLYIGSKNANEYVIAWDGDLLVHPNDIAMCLNYDGEYIGCSDIISDDTVFVKLNDNNEVKSFSYDDGDFEWSGPAKLKKDKIKYISSNVFNQIEEYLPLPMLKISAQDIDTYNDFKRAQQFIRSWRNE